MAGMLLAGSACHKGEPPGEAPRAFAPLVVPPPSASSLHLGRARHAAAPLPPFFIIAFVHHLLQFPPTRRLHPRLRRTRTSANADKPNTDAAFDARARALFDGIVHDDPERAMPFFFPLGAYQQVKAIANPSPIGSTPGPPLRARHPRAAKEGRPRCEAPSGGGPAGGRWVSPTRSTTASGISRVWYTNRLERANGEEKVDSYQLDDLLARHLVRVSISRDSNEDLIEQETGRREVREFVCALHSQNLPVFSFNLLHRTNGPTPRTGPHGLQDRESRSRRLRGVEFGDGVWAGRNSK